MTPRRPWLLAGFSQHQCALIRSTHSNKVGLSWRRVRHSAVGSALTVQPGSATLAGQAMRSELLTREGHDGEAVEAARESLTAPSATMKACSYPSCRRLHRCS